MNKVSLLAIFSMMFVFGLGNNLHVSAQADTSDSFFDDNTANDAAGSAVKSATEVSGSVVSDSVPTEVDANGNMTIKTNEDYGKSITLESGKNLTLEANAAVKGNITLNGGNLTLGDNVDITGNVKVNGNIISKGNLNIVGAVTANTFTAGNNIDVSGPMNISSTQTITLGNNVDLKSTLTSPAGLQIGSNSDVKLFLSGETATIDGKDYKLGGKIIKEGANTDVNLPFVPKQKNADGSAVQVTKNTPDVTLSISAQENIGKTEGDKNKTEKTDATNSDEGDFVMPDVSKILNEEDVNNYVSKVITGDTNVANLKLNTEDVGLDYKVPASLFGFIPMSLPTNVKVSKDKNVDVAFPWYSFLFSKAIDENTIKENISNNINTTIDSNTDTTGSLSVKMQASIVNSVLSSLKGLFGNK